MHCRQSMNRFEPPAFPVPEPPVPGVKAAQPVLPGWKLRVRIKDYAFHLSVACCGTFPGERFAGPCAEEHATHPQVPPHHDRMVLALRALRPLPLLVRASSSFGSHTPGLPPSGHPAQEQCTAGKGKEEQGRAGNSREQQRRAMKSNEQQRTSRNSNEQQRRKVCAWDCSRRQVVCVTATSPCPPVRRFTNNVLSTAQTVYLRKMGGATPAATTESVAEIIDVGQAKRTPAPAPPPPEQDTDAARGERCVRARMCKVLHSNITFVCCCALCWWAAAALAACSVAVSPCLIFLRRQDCGVLSAQKWSKWQCVSLTWNPPTLSLPSSPLASFEVSRFRGLKQSCSCVTPCFPTSPLAWFCVPRFRRLKQPCSCVTPHLPTSPLAWFCVPRFRRLKQLEDEKAARRAFFLAFLFSGAVEVLKFQCTEVVEMALYVAHVGPHPPAPAFPPRPLPRSVSPDSAA